MGWEEGETERDRQIQRENIKKPNTEEKAKKGSSYCFWFFCICL